MVDFKPGDTVVVVGHVNFRGRTGVVEYQCGISEPNDATQVTLDSGTKWAFWTRDLRPNRGPW